MFQDCSGDVDTWHEDVRFYRIYDKQSTRSYKRVFLGVLMVCMLFENDAHYRQLALFTLVQQRF